MDCANCFSSPPVTRRRKPRPAPLVRLRDRTRPRLDNRPPTPYPSQFIRSPTARRALPNRPVRLHHVEAVTVSVRRPSRRATIVEIPPPEHLRRPRSTYHRPTEARRHSVRTSNATFVVPKSPSREQRHRESEESIQLKIAKQNAEINARPRVSFSSRRSDAPDDFLRSFSGLNLGHGDRK